MPRIVHLIGTLWLGNSSINALSQSLNDPQVLTNIPQKEHFVQQYTVFINPTLSTWYVFLLCALQ